MDILTPPELPKRVGVRKGEGKSAMRSPSNYGLDKSRSQNTEADRALACYYCLKGSAVTLLLMLNGAYFAEFTKASCEGNIYCLFAIRE